MYIDRLKILVKLSLPILDIASNNEERVSESKRKYNV